MQYHTPKAVQHRTANTQLQTTKQTSEQPQNILFFYLTQRKRRFCVIYATRRYAASFLTHKFAPETIFFLVKNVSSAKILLKLPVLAFEFELVNEMLLPLGWEQRKIVR